MRLVFFTWESIYYDEAAIPLTTLSEDQRAQAHTRFTIIRPALEDGVTQAQVARTHDISKSTMGRWVKRYRENGLAGLADAQVRSDKGMPRRLPAEAVTLIEGLALQTLPRTIAAITPVRGQVLAYHPLPPFFPTGITVPRDAQRDF